MSFIRIGHHRFQVVLVKDIKPEMKIILDRCIVGKVINCLPTSRVDYFDIMLETKSGKKVLAQKKFNTRVGLVKGDSFGS